MFEPFALACCSDAPGYTYFGESPLEMVSFIPVLRMVLSRIDRASSILRLAMDDIGVRLFGQDRKSSKWRTVA